MRTLDSPADRRSTDSDRSRDTVALARFAVVAIPIGWVLLSMPILLDQPFEPYVLGVLLLGLVVPALVLTRRDPGATVRSDLLGDLLRLPRPAWLLLPTVAVVPGLTWFGASSAGSAEPLGRGLIESASVNMIWSLLIVNLWEEMAWTGFVQRRAMRAWGMLRGSALTAVLFAAIHAPLAADGAHDAGELVQNAGILLGSALGLRLLIGALDRAGGHSLLAVAVLHASFNAAALFVQPADDWIRYLVVMALGAVVGIATIVARSRAQR